MTLDVVRFTPSSLGANTAGTFAWYFDGSDVDLTRNGEDLDTLSFATDGRNVFSTTGNFSVSGISGNDEDLIAFTPTALGATTSGSWTLFFDGSDVGLNDLSSEDIKGAWIDPLNGHIYLTVVGAFSVTGVTGDGSDIFVCVPTSLGANTACTFSMYWDGSANGFGGELLDGFSIAR